MAVLPILTEENPILRRKAKKIAKLSKRLKGLAKDMLETMNNAKGVGLAAPQVGVSERMIVINVGDGPITVINPQIIDKEGEDKDVEGCLSVLNRSEYITRAQKVIVTGLNLDGRKVQYEGNGLLARVFQHEIDHLDGILFIDYVKDKEQ